MPIHPPTQTGFIHIPKCGGTSVEQVLCCPKPLSLCIAHRYLHHKQQSLFVRWTGWAYYLWGDTWRACCTIVVGWFFWVLQWWRNDDPFWCHPYHNLLTHTPLCELSDELLTTTDRWFTIVRNPYDRLVSAYTHLELDRLPTGPYPFETFCADARDHCATHIDQHGRFRFHSGANVFLLPQYVFVCDTEAHRCVVDRVLRFEQLDNEWKALRQEWGLVAYVPERLPHMNQSRPRLSPRTRPTRTRLPDGTSWTPELRDVVYSIYQRDFEWFGYARR